MKDLDKVYAESVAKEYMPKETNKLRQLKKLDERAKLPAFLFSPRLHHPKMICGSGRRWAPTSGCWRPKWYTKN